MEAKAGAGEPAEDDGASACRHNTGAVVDLSGATREVRGGRGVVVGGTSVDLAVNQGCLFEGHDRKWPH